MTDKPTIADRQNFETPAHALKNLALDDYIQRNSTGVSSAPETSFAGTLNWTEANVFHPAYNTGIVQPYNALANLFNAGSHALGGSDLLPKASQAKVDQADFLSKEWLAQSLSSGLGAIASYTLASKLTNLGFQGGTRVLGMQGAAAEIATSRFCATVSGAALLDGLRDKRPGETTLGNITTGTTTMLMLGLGNRFSGNLLGADLLASRLVVGSAGASSSLLLSEYLTHGRVATTEELSQAGLTGSMLNVAMPVLQDMLRVGKPRTSQISSSEKSRTSPSTEIETETQPARQSGTADRASRQQCRDALSTVLAGVGNERTSGETVVPRTQPGPHEPLREASTTEVGRPPSLVESTGSTALTTNFLMKIARGEIKVPPLDVTTRAQLPETAAAYEPGTHEAIVRNTAVPGRRWDSQNQFIATACDTVTQPARIYNKSGRVEIAVPEELAAKLDEVRTLRQQAQGSGEPAATAAKSLAQHQYGNYVLPEDMIKLLDLLPNDQQLRRITLVDYQNPLDEFGKLVHGDNFQSAADTSKNKDVIFYQKQHDRSLLPQLFHEWYHRQSDANPGSRSVFTLAADLEKNGYHDSNYARQPRENEALHMGEYIMDPDGGRLWFLAHNAPLRTTALGRALGQAADLQPGRAAAQLWRARADLIESAVAPVARAKLVELATSANESEAAKAVQLLTQIGTPADMAGLPQTTLTLRGLPINESVSRNIAAMPNLRDLDLSYNKFKPDALNPLANCNALERLNLSFTPTGDRNIIRLSRLLPNLNELLLESTSVSNAISPYVAQAKRMTSLTLVGTDFKPLEIQQLQSKIPGTVINGDR